MERSPQLVSKVYAHRLRVYLKLSYVSWRRSTTRFTLPSLRGR